jgi:phenylpyruvate tautomerase PptA (4-oxalocrotonate tautomerase family)
MPFVEVTTSARLVDSGQQRALLHQVTRLTAQHLDKRPAYVMVKLTEGAAMEFAGNDEPCAHVAVNGIGTPRREQVRVLTKALCDEIERALGVSGDRTYVVFTPVPRELWGLDGSMFG